MIHPFQLLLAILGVWTVFVLPSMLHAASPSTLDVVEGTIIYEQSCLVCHGASGKGDGPASFYNAAFSASRARDFTVGNYKFRSTVSGSPSLR